jgi:branched-chain amino acid transport system ATP-binding protein
VAQLSVPVDQALLQLEGIELSFAGVRALKGVSLDVQSGELLAIIGPNGAGKTSLFNCISGLYRPQVGAIRFDGADILGAPAHARAGLGIARMFQNLALYEHLTVLDNLLVGCHHRFSTPWWADMLWNRRARTAELEARALAEDVIDFLNLEAVRKTPAGILPYGVLKRVELGRALCMEPKLLLLDEPAAGLNREETEDMARFILDIKEERGIAQILIEHDLHMVLDLADRVAVLDFGQRIALGTPAEVRVDPAVRAAYLGAVGGGAA